MPMSILFQALPYRQCLNEVLTPPRSYTGFYAELSHCGADAKQVYLDVVALIDQSESMGQEGTDEVIA